MEKMFKFNGRVVCAPLREAHIETVVTENDRSDIIIRRTLKITFKDAEPLRVYNDLYGCIAGSELDRYDEGIMMEFLRLVHHRDRVDFDECVDDGDDLTDT
jgi:hypothetical protein